MAKFKVTVVRIGNTFFVNFSEKLYRLRTNTKIGRRLIVFHKMAKDENDMANEIVSHIVVPVEDIADLYKLIPTKRGREIIDRFVERSKKEGEDMKEDTT